MRNEPTPLSPFGRPGQDRLSTWSWQASRLLPCALSATVVIAGYALDDLTGLVLGLAVVALFWAHEAWCVRRTRSGRQ